MTDDNSSNDQDALRPDVQVADNSQPTQQSNNRMTLAEFARQENLTYGTAYKIWRSNLPPHPPRVSRRRKK